MNYIKSEKEFDEVIQKDKVIVDFYAEWCGPCKMLSPILDKVSKELSLDTYKVNVDDVEEVARRYGIMSIPTVMIFSKGEEVGKHVGFMEEEELKEFVK
jgi:thioredoxin 1